MDRMQATPRNAFFGGLADFLAAGSSPQRTQQMQGLMEFLQVPDYAKTLDRVSYGEPLTTGRGMTTQMHPETENTLMAALGMLPAGRPAGAAVDRGAMALGRAGERFADDKIPAIMERGGLPAEMLSAMSQGTQSPATVFHGSPHRFTKFDSSKIGTGEGAQVYGHGLYLAENPSVASEYAKILQKPTNSMFAEEFLEKINPQLLQKLREATGGDKYSSNAGKAYMRPSDFNLLPELKKEVLAFKKNSSNLYQVNLPDEQIAKMLDYDKPLSKQPKNVRKALESIVAPVRSKMAKPASKEWGEFAAPQAFNPTGQELLQMLSQDKNLSAENVLSGGFGAAAAAKARDLGIPGIRYLDQGSRGAGKGTSNFVVFPGMEDMLRIEQINEQPINSLLQTLGR